MNESVLYLIFKNTLGNSFTITIDAPREDLEEQNIVDAMNLIKQKNIFQLAKFHCQLLFFTFQKKGNNILLI